MNKQASKQLRVSNSAFDEIKRFADEFDIDKRTFISASIVLLKAIIEHDASSIKFENDNGEQISMPVPLVFKRKK